MKIAGWGIIMGLFLGLVLNVSGYLLGVYIGGLDLSQELFLKQGVTTALLFIFVGTVLAIGHNWSPEFLAKNENITFSGVVFRPTLIGFLGGAGMVISFYLLATLVLGDYIPFKKWMFISNLSIGLLTEAAFVLAVSFYFRLRKHGQG